MKVISSLFVSDCYFINLTKGYMQSIYNIAAVILTLVSIQHGCTAQSEPSGVFAVAEKVITPEVPDEMIHESFKSPLWKHGRVHVFYQHGLVDKCPAIFLTHTYGATNPEAYLSLIKHIVNKGYVVVFSPTRRVTFTTKQIHKYDIIFAGYIEAVLRFPGIIDTSRIGFVGHGFGGGAAPALMLRAIRKRTWGQSGSFIYIIAPWYMHSMDQRSLETYPEIVKLVVQVFNGDKINDPGIAADIFNSIAIPDSNKVFRVAASDIKGMCVIHPGDGTPQTKDLIPDNDPVVYNSIYRTFDDLAGYTFNCDMIAKLNVFPKKDSTVDSITTGVTSIPFCPLIVTHTTRLFLKNEPYLNPWLSPLNPRVEVSALSKTKMLKQIYYRNAWSQYASFAGKNLKRLFVDNKSPDTLVNPIKKGYGAPGENVTITDTFVNPVNHALKVYVFHPRNALTPRPAIFFFHGYVGKDPDKFRSLIRQMVGKGYIVIYPTYSFFPRPDNTKNILAKYDEINAGIKQAVQRYKKDIDTTRIGFFGQSFGASAIPSVAYRLITEKHWGTTGAFMFLSAPWYVYGLPQQNLHQFPAHVNLIIQVYNDDIVNDHEIAVDLFNSIGIPQIRKKYYTVYSDSSNGYVMHANHFTAYGVGNVNGEQNLLDYYGIYKLFDALATYSFTGCKSGREMSLDIGTTQQLYMGTWSNGRSVVPMAVTDNPRAYNPESQYMYTFNNPLNPGKRYTP